MQINLTYDFSTSSAPAASEFTAKFGANPSNDAYVTELYTNVLGRAPDAAGLAYWEGQANSGVARDQLLVAFATSAENLQTHRALHRQWLLGDLNGGFERRSARFARSKLLITFRRRRRDFRTASSRSRFALSVRPSAMHKSY